MLSRQRSAVFYMFQRYGRKIAQKKRLQPRFMLGEYHHIWKENGVMGKSTTTQISEILLLFGSLHFVARLCPMHCHGDGEQQLVCSPTSISRGRRW